MSDPEKLKKIAFNKVVIDTKAIAIMAYILLASLFVVYGFWFSQDHLFPFSTDTADWGAFGDFIGGIGNPIVALATLFIVANGYILQRQELSSTVEAMRDTAKEQKEQSGYIKKQNELRVFQQLIDIETALLNTNIAEHNSMITEMDRIASVLPHFDPSRGWVDLLVYTRVGEPLKDKNARQEYIKERVTILNQMASKIKTSVTKIETLRKQILAEPTQPTPS